jgi:UDP-N-acetyl-D-mannosaminuronate dehydrogenase
MELESTEPEGKGRSRPDANESIKSSLSRASWKIPASYLEAMKRAEVLFVAADHHAYRAVEGKGLERMIQVALDAQHK